MNVATTLVHFFEFQEENGAQRCVSEYDCEYLYGYLWSETLEQLCPKVMGIIKLGSTLDDGLTGQLDECLFEEAKAIINKGSKHEPTVQVTLEQIVEQINQSPEPLVPILPNTQSDESAFELDAFEVAQDSVQAPVFVAQDFPATNVQWTTVGLLQLNLRLLEK